MSKKKPTEKKIVLPRMGPEAYWMERARQLTREKERAEEKIDAAYDLLKAAMSLLK